MIVATIAFYLFSLLTAAGALCVVSARNPVHSVLFLIFTFINCAALFLLLSAEFLAMILAIVYVGAVAVLFLFVVMMLNISFDDAKNKFVKYRVVAFVLGAIMIGEFCFIAYSWTLSPDSQSFTSLPVLTEEHATNTHALAAVLYTDFAYLFQLAGLILLVAMVGAIVLTHRRREGVIRQSIDEQVHRPREASVELRKMPKGQGVQW